MMMKFQIKQKKENMILKEKNGNKFQKKQKILFKN